MNARAAAVGILVAAGLGLAAWRTWGTAPEPAPADPVAASAGAPNGAGAASQPVEAPGDAPPTDSAREKAASVPPPPPPPLEPVEPMLELNYVVWNAAQSASDDGVSGSIDELLGGKHAGKDKAQLQLSLRSIDAVLQRQQDPGGLPKDQILAPEALSALAIERDWLKQRMQN